MRLWDRTPTPVRTHFLPVCAQPRPLLRGAPPNYLSVGPGHDHRLPGILHAVDHDHEKPLAGEPRLGEVALASSAADTA